MKIRYLFISLLFTLIINSAIAQNYNPVNSNYLIENGVSPRMLDAAASLFKQDGSFTNNSVLIRETNGVTKEYQLDIIYDPNFENGMDIRVVNKSGELSKREKKTFKKYIESSHYFSRMSRDYLYNETTLKVIRTNRDTVVFEYYYKKKDVDPYLKKIKKLKGNIYFVNGTLLKVVLTNIKPLKKHITHYSKTVYYAPIKEGGYVVTGFEEYATAEKGKNLTNSTLTTHTTHYYGNDGEELGWNGKKKFEETYTGSFDTVTVKLGGTLPFLGKQATKLGFKLPRPVGVAGFVYAHDQLMEFTGLEVAFNGGKLLNLENLFALEDSKVSQSTFMAMLKADLWILPFLNIMAIIGGGKNDLNGELVINDDLRDFFNNLPGFIIDIPNLPRSIPINTTVRSEIYGFGLTLAGGIQNFNLSVNYQLMFTKIVEANTTNLVNIITPMVGYMTPLGINFMVGAQGQYYNTKLTGFFDFDDKDGVTHRIDYIVDFEPVKWNGILGIYMSLSKHWEMSLQYGFGKRASVTGVFGYRF
jgi:hypothetical protein